jgi:hypothetical protein
MDLPADQYPASALNYKGTLVANDWLYRGAVHKMVLGAVFSFGGSGPITSCAVDLLKLGQLCQAEAMTVPPAPPRLRENASPLAGGWPMKR